MELNILKNAKNNIAFGIVNKVVLIILPFIERTVMQRLMGELFLGMNSLFSSVLSVLNLAEMGFGAAIVYHMYKPIAENDTDTVNALLNFYRRIYRIIGMVVLVIGLSLVPFLSKLINGAIPENINITVIYLLFLCDAVYSYFLFAYMGSILTAYQREDIRSKINSIITILLYTSKMIVVATIRSYYIYVSLIPAYAIIQNLWIAFSVHKKYPQYCCKGEIDQAKKNNIRKLVTGTFISKISAVTRNSLDSLCTSAFLGLSLTAVYNNYYMISASVTALLGIVASAFLGGIGNHVATRSVDENYTELELLDFFYMLISGICTCCLLCLYQPFMKLWMGDNLILPFPAVILFCVYFYILKLGDMRTMYSTANGLWWYHRFRAMGETIANLILNVILGKIFGIYGIISATIISMIICNYLWATRVTFEHYFGDTLKRNYYIYHIKYASSTVVICSVVYLLCNICAIKNNFLDLAVKAIICTCSSCMLYFVRYHNNPLFKKGIDKIFNRF